MAEDERDQRDEKDEQEEQDQGPDQPNEEDAGITRRDQVQALKEDFSPSKLNSKLEDVIEERPKTAHLLDFRIVGQALLAAAVVALILWLLIGPKIAALALVLVFGGVWLIGAQMSYDRRRQTRDARSDGDEDDGEDPNEGNEEEDAPARQAEARS